MPRNPMYGQLDLPATFPRADAEFIEAQLTRNPAPAWWPYFGGAWLAMAYRFRAAVECGNAWSRSVIASGDAPPMNDRYVQERELFGFATNACSALDCFAFGVAAAAGEPTFDVLTARGRRNISFETVAGNADTGYGGGALARTLTVIRQDQTYTRLVDLRNLLVHRAAPSRDIVLGGVSSLSLKRHYPDDPGLVLSPTTMDDLSDWLGVNVQQLVADARTWVLGMTS